MKKVLIITVVLSFFLLFTTNIYAIQENLLSNENVSKIVEIKEKEVKEIDNYEERYGNRVYGTTAYILNKIRIYSIPACFLGIAIGSIYQYVIGIRKLDVRDKGFMLIISFVTVLVICQILPLIFAVVVKGWRG